MAKIFGSPIGRRTLIGGAARPRAGVVELVDAPDSKSGSERSVGSTPTTRTITVEQAVPARLTCEPALAASRTAKSGEQGEGVASVDRLPLGLRHPGLVQVRHGG